MNNELNNQELQKVEKYRQKEIDKVNSSKLTDDQKADKLEYLKSMEFHKLGEPLNTGKCKHDYIQDEPNHYICTHCGLGFLVR